ETLAQVLQDERMIGGHIVQFPGIPGEVVEFVATVLVIVDTLPITRTDDGGRLAALVAVMRVMPQKIALRNVLSAQNGDEAHAVNVLLGTQRQPGKLEQGRINIGVDRRRIRLAPLPQN